MNEVANISTQLVVCLLHEVLPLEDGIRLFWTVYKEIVSPDLDRDVDFLDSVSEDTLVSGLGELTILVVEIFGDRDVMKQGVVLFRSQ